MKLITHTPNALTLRLSRRNLVALLYQLDNPTISSGTALGQCANKRHPEDPTQCVLVEVFADEDAPHYAHRSTT